MSPAEQWIDLVILRSGELRRAGVLSIGCDGNSAVLAPAEPELDKSDDKPATQDANEPSNAWENPASYPSGHVPTLEVEDMPEIQQFGDL